MQSQQRIYSYGKAVLFVIVVLLYLIKWEKVLCWKIQRNIMYEKVAAYQRQHKY